MLLEVCVFTLLRGLVGVHILKLLRRHKAHTALKLAEAAELRIDRLHGILRVANRLHNVHDRELEVVEIAVFRKYDLFPVPLVDVDGVKIVKLVLVAAYCVHVGVKSLSGVEAVALQRQTLPLRKRLHDLCVSIGAQNVKADGALVAVEVVVKSGIRLDKQRCGHSVEVQQCAEPVLKKAL